MALPAATVWEVRPATGSDNNGGGFVAGASGTDYSQQDSAQYNATDLAVDSSVNTKVTSATHNFVSADVGNLIHITAGSGWTQGFYEIVSVASNAATLDRSPASVSTTGGTYAVGGALATISKAYGSAVGCNTIYIKGTYTATAVLLLTALVNTTPFFFIGYSSTRGDGGQCTWTTATNSTYLIQPSTSNPANYIFQNISFTTSAGTKVAAIDGSLNSQGVGWKFVNCTWNGFPSAMNADYVNSVHYNLAILTLEQCVIKNCTSHGIRCCGGTVFINCNIHDNTGDGIHCEDQPGSGLAAQGPIVLIRTVVYNNGANGCTQKTGNSSFSNSNYLSWIFINSALLNSGGDGFQATNNGAGPTIQAHNTIIENNGGYGVNNLNGDVGAISFYNCAWRNNTSGDTSGTGIAKGPNDVTLTAECFTSIGSDYTLNSTSGGGAACKGAGFPSSIPS